MYNGRKSIMKTVTLILNLTHILASAAMLVLMPTVWADAPFGEAAL